MGANLIKKRFEVIDHTADIGLKAYGDSLGELFENFAYGIFSQIADLDNVEERDSFEIVLEAEDQEELLVDWLNELLYISDARKTILKKFEISEITETQLRAMVFGEKMDHQRHRIYTYVKAATYYDLKIEHDGIWQGQVIFDV
ncbi:MAG: Protein archease [Actinobacteria bacterium]|nr:Protein archease [Actinomycetota bacterium]